MEGVVLVSGVTSYLRALILESNDSLIGVCLFFLGLFSGQTVFKMALSMRVTRAWVLSIRDSFCIIKLLIKIAGA